MSSSTSINYLTSGTINGLSSLELTDLITDDLVTENLQSNNINGDFFSIDTIEARDVQVDNELDLTETGFITIAKGTGNEINISDSEIGYLDGLTSNLQTQINNITNDSNLIDTDLTDLKNMVAQQESDINDIEIKTDFILIDNDNFQIQAQNKNIQLWSDKIYLGNTDVSLYINNEIQTHAYTDADHTIVNNVGDMESDINTNTIAISEITTITDRFSETSDQFQLISNDKNVRFETDSLVLWVDEINIKWGSHIFLNGGTQNYAFTDADRTQISTNSLAISTQTTDLNLLEVVVGQNLSNISTNSSAISTLTTDLNLLEVDVASNIQRLDALENNRIQSSKIIDWYSVRPTGVPWAYSYSAISTHAHNLANNSPAPNDFYDNNGQWDAGTKKLLISFESAYTLQGCHITQLRSKIRVLHSGHGIKGESLYSGYNLIDNYLVQDSYTYNGQIIITINNGDFIFIMTNYHILTSSSSTTPFDCEFVVNYTELL